MKVLLFTLTTLTLASCGITLEQPEDEGGIGVNQTVTAKESDKFTEAEVKIAQKICTALSEKETYFDRFVANSNVLMGYDLRIKDCGQRDAQSNKFNSRVTSSGDRFTLAANINGAFKDIITTDSKIMEDICDGISSSETRYSSGSSIKNWLYFVDSSSSRCSGDNNVCLYVETGYKLSGSEYKIKDVEAFKFSLTENTRKGFVINRAFETSQRCTSGTYVKEQIFTGTATE